MIQSVSINGQPLDPGMVLAQVTISHGRRIVGDGPAASTATVIVEQRGAMPTWRGGDLLTVEHSTGRLFTGRVTDRTLEHSRDVDGVYGTFTITATGPTARLGVRVVGDVPFPQEPATARAERVLQLAGMPYVIDGPADMAILPRDVDAQPALDLLEELQRDTAAAVFDLPTGEVVYQPMSGRQRPVIPYMWSDFPPAQTWAASDPALTWNGDPPSIGDWDSPRSKFPLDIPGSVTLWAPQWRASEGVVVNHARIGWGLVPEGGQQATVEAVEQSSIDRHGRRYAYLGTQLAVEGDAQERATHIVSTQSIDRWALDDVDIQLDLTDPQFYNQVMALRCGDHVVLHDLPTPNPAITWPAIVEGWTYIELAEAELRREQLTLILSDPLLSLAVMRWDDYPGTYPWQGHPPAVTWMDLTQTSVLTP